MPSTTPKLALPYSLGADSLGSVDDTMQALAERLELLLPFTFRTGTLTVAAVDTSYSQRINYPTGKSFPVGVVPTVQVTPEVTAPTAIVTVSAIDNTGFTINWRRIQGNVNIGDVSVTVQRVTP